MEMPEISVGAMMGWILLLIGLIFFFSSIRIIKQWERGLVERFGKYNRFASPGFNLIIPIIENMRIVDIQEDMVNSEKREIITKDNLNAQVDSQVYFKIKDDEVSIKASQYNVTDYESMIVALAKTTLRNILGTMTLKEANSERGKINQELLKTLEKETHAWGIEIVRTEIKEIEPPKDVQASMNQVVKAQNEKDAAVDLATAAETKADGDKRAIIKVAQANAEAIKIVNESAEKYFTKNAMELKKLEVLENCLKNNTKVILTEKGITPQLIIGDVPLVVKQ